MRLFEKMNKNSIQNNRLSVYVDYVISDYKFVMVRVNKLKEIITELSHTRKSSQAQERENLCNSLLTILDMVSDKYYCYLFDLSDLVFFLLNNQDMQAEKRVSQKAMEALDSKKLLRNEFETIYRNFKSMAKKLDNVPMNQILKAMREAFDFEGKTFRSEALYTETKAVEKFID